MATIDPTQRAHVTWFDYEGPERAKLTVSWLDPYTDREMAWDLRGLDAYWIAQCFKARDAKIKERDATIANLRADVAHAREKLDEARAMLRQRHGMECPTYDDATGTCGGCEVSVFLGDETKGAV